MQEIKCLYFVICVFGTNIRAEKNKWTCFYLQSRSRKLPDEPHGDYQSLSNNLLVFNPTVWKQQKIFFSKVVLHLNIYIYQSSQPNPKSRMKIKALKKISKLDFSSAGCFVPAISCFIHFIFQHHWTFLCCLTSDVFQNIWILGCVIEVAK